MYVTPEEITTHLGAAQIEAISNGNDSDLDIAIKAAIKQVRGYLTAYDVDAELAKTRDDRNELLIMWIKDIAVWHFVNSCNVNTSLELRAKRKDDAIADLTKTQKGNFSIELPEKINNSGVNDNMPYKITSNQKRNNHV
jgi:hypothetical protein